MRSIKIEFKSDADFFGDIRAALAKRVSLIQHSDTIIFDNYRSFQKFMFPNRFDVLVAIKVFKPTSMYQLAKALHRHHQAILKDCNALETAGFIKTEQTGTDRNQRVPRFIFDFDVIVDHNTDMGEITHSLPSKAA